MCVYFSKIKERKIIMINPGITVLEKCLDDKCRYTLVAMAAKRARMIANERIYKEKIAKANEEVIDIPKEKPVTVAVNEIAEGRVKYNRDMKSIEEMNERKRTLHENINFIGVTDEDLSE